MLPWNPLDYPLTLGVSLLATLICCLSVILRPKLLWPLVIFVPPITAQFKMGRYCITDELTLAGLLLGAIIKISQQRGGQAQKNAPRLNNRHVILFLAMSWYMVLQSFRGAFVTEDIRMLRYVAYFAMFAIFLTTANRGIFPIPSPRHASLVGTWMLFVSMGIYLLFGFYSVLVLGTGLWDGQEDTWAGSAAAVFPLVLGLPAAFFCLVDKSKWRRALAVATFAITVITSNYYDSRIGVLAAVAFAMLLPVMNRMSTVTLIIPLLISGFVFSQMKRGHNPLDPDAAQAYMGEYFANPSQAFTNPDRSDQGRNVAFFAGWSAALSDWKIALIGGGMYSHKDIMPAFVDKEYGNFADAHARYGYGGSTAGFSAILVDTGIVGIGLMYGNMLLTLWGLFRQRFSAKSLREKLLLILSISLIALWPIICNITDHVLYYLMIMPGGVLTLIGSEATLAANRPRVIAHFQPHPAMRRLHA